MSQQDLWAPSCAQDAGVQPEPYTLQGYYDALGNYIPGYYDEEGAYHLGYVYFDDAGDRHVVHGYYDTEGEWIEGALPDDEEIGDLERYTAQYFESEGGDTLEITMIWQDHVLSVRQYADDAIVHIGPGEDNDYVLEDPSLLGAKFPLLTRNGERRVLCFVPGMQGWFAQGAADAQSLEELAEVAPVLPSLPGARVLILGPKSSARLDFGGVTLLIGFAERSRAIGGLGAVDAAPLRYIGASAIAHAALLLLTFTMPPDAEALALDMAAADDRFASLMTIPEQTEEELPEELGAKDAVDAAGHKGPEGKAGDERSAPTNKRMAIAGESKELKIARDRRAALGAGALAVLNAQDSPFGQGAETLGADVDTALGGLLGEETGIDRGFGGLGLRDGGRGGPGDSDKSIGLDGDITKRLGGGDGKRYPKPKIAEREGKVPKPQVIPGPIRTADCMSKESIKKVVRQRRREIQYCYEKGLQKNPQLAGQVGVNMKINSTGSVFAVSIKSSTLKNATVESCIRTKIMRWNFAPPQGCALVNVNYPFRFRR